MIVGIKDSAKLFGISIIACCAVLVCAMFMNFQMDLVGIRDEITSELAMTFYEAQLSTAKVVVAVSGGCLLITSVIMLIFYVKHYIDTHKKELGILKALGYSNMKIAKHFYVFGISVLIGTLVGIGGAFLLMPLFYEVQNKDKFLPEIIIGFHPSLFLYFVLIPTAAFALLAIFYAQYKLRKPVLTLLKDSPQSPQKIKKQKESDNKEWTFTDYLKKSTLKSKKSLVFFIFFAAFCFSSMTQMSFSMKVLSSEMMAVMMILIGLVLSFTTLFIAVTTVVHGNTKTIAMMRVFGYSRQECGRAILGGYRPFAYIGFAVGSVYQYILLRIMVDIVFKDIENVPEYHFDFPAMLISLTVFVAVYEWIMVAYSERIKKISVKEIMLE